MDYFKCLNSKNAQYASVQLYISANVPPEPSYVNLTYTLTLPLLWPDIFWSLFDTKLFPMTDKS